MMVAIVAKDWCPVKDLNPQSLASKASAFAIFANRAAGSSGGRRRIRTSTDLPTCGLQPRALPNRRSVRWAVKDLNLQKAVFETAAFADFANGPLKINGVGIAIVTGWSGRLDSNQRFLASKASDLTWLAYAQCQSVAVR